MNGLGNFYRISILSALVLPAVLPGKDYKNAGSIFRVFAAFGLGEIAVWATMAAIYLATFAFFLRDDEDPLSAFD